MKFTIEEVNGIPLMQLRDFLRRHWKRTDPFRVSCPTIESMYRREWRRYIRTNPNLRTSEAAEKQAVVRAETERTLQACLKAEFVDFDLEETIGLTPTDLGNKLKRASLRRYSRAAAQKQLNQFLNRCRTVNGMTPNMAEPLSLCQVMSVTFFGSYARGAMDVGDVDLVVKVQIRDVPEAHRYIEQVTKLPFLEAAAHHPIVIAENYLFKSLNILATTDILPGNLSPDEVILCDVG